MSIENVMYRAHAKAIGGRDGRALSSDNVLDLKLTVPREMGGAGLTARAGRSPGTESPHRLPVLQCNTRQH